MLAPAAALAACGRRRGTGFEGYAFVANEEGRAIAVVDLVAFAVARHIVLDARPGPVIADAARPAVYVLSPEAGVLYQIATAKLAIERRLQVCRSAVAMRLSTDGNALWVLCRSPQQLVRIPLDRFRRESAIALAAEPLDFDLADGAQAALVSYGAAGAVAVLDLARGVSQTFHFGKKLSLARFRMDAAHILIGNLEDRTLIVADARAGRVIVQLPLAVRPDNFCFKSDGGQLFVTGEGMDAVTVVYPFSTEVAETVLAGRAPGAMAEYRAADADADYLLVANPQSGEVTILDIDTRRVIAVVAVGDSPGFIEITPDKQYALVLNRRSGDMAVIRMAAVAANRTKSAPLFTMIPVGSRPVCAAVRGV